MKKTLLQRRIYTIEEIAEILGLERNNAYVAARANRLLGEPSPTPPAQFAVEPRECVWDDSVLDAEPITP